MQSHRNAYIVEQTLNANFFTSSWNLVLPKITQQKLRVNLPPVCLFKIKTIAFAGAPGEQLTGALSMSEFSTCLSPFVEGDFELTCDSKKLLILNIFYNFITYHGSSIWQRISPTLPSFSFGT